MAGSSFTSGLVKRILLLISQATIPPTSQVNMCTSVYLIALTKTYFHLNKLGFLRKGFSVIIFKVIDILIKQTDIFYLFKFDTSNSVAHNITIL